MATLAQVQAETYWGREIVPDALDWLADQLCAHYKLPRVHAGTKGDRAHLRGAHRSQEWIRKSRYCTNRTYTTTAGLSVLEERYIAGLDFTPGSPSAMQQQCRRLDAAMRAGQLEDVTEFYGNLNGDKVVDGWDNIANRAASSDSSHLWHWHLTFRRNAVDKRAVMEKVLRIVTGQQEDTTMALTPQDIDAIAKRVWTIDNVVPAPTDRTDQANRYWGPGAVLAWATNSAAAAKTTAALVLAKATVGDDNVDEQAIVAGVLAGLNAEAIAAAIPGDLAEQVSNKLLERIGKAFSGPDGA